MLNVITLFSGYDSQALALNRLGIPYDLVAWAEIDKHACTAHDALFPQYKDRNLGDVSRVNWTEWHTRHPQPIDLLTYSSPCQDFSSAGLQAGGDEGSGTRSGLLWEVEKAIAALKPRHLVFENVAALVSDKFIGVFNKWQTRLNGYGYTNFQQLMNAKDYGVPQNRLRIFMVSILDCQRAYYFPKPFRLERRLKDVLEQNVDERYYLSDERVAKLMQETAIHRDRGNGFAFRPHTPEEIASTVKCSGIGDKTDNFVAEPQMLGWSRNDKGEITNRHPVSVANCITVAKHDTTQNYIVEPTIAAMRGRDKDNPNDRGKSTDNYVQRLELKPDGTSNTLTSVAKDNLLIEPRCKQVGQLYDKEDNPQNGRIYDPSGLCPSIMANKQGGQREPKIIEPYDCIYYNQSPDFQRPPLKNIGRTVKADSHQPAVAIPENQDIRIRRLTERELYRLMDVSEADIDTLLATPIPRTQHAKLAGNSIAVACLYYIFDRLFVHTNADVGTQTTLF